MTLKLVEKFTSTIVIITQWFNKKNTKLFMSYISHA